MRVVKVVKFAIEGACKYYRKEGKVKYTFDKSKAKEYSKREAQMLADGLNKKFGDGRRHFYVEED